jgi:hypothetical protein
MRGFFVFGESSPPNWQNRRPIPALTSLANLTAFLAVNKEFSESIPSIAGLDGVGSLVLNVTGYWTFV